jgi:ABC-2 type transport system ATP-binding protein
MTQVLRVEGVSQKFSLKQSRTIQDRFTRKPLKQHHFWALEDISFNVEQGTSLSLLGANGSGKSTLLKVIGGIYRPTKGRVLHKGRLGALLELGAGFHPELTGRENIFLNGAIMGLDKKTIVSKMDEVIDFSGIEDFIDNPVKTYSSGMFVRLGFSIAVNAEPDILLVDEVLAVGDENFQSQCLSKVREIQKSGTSIILVTHSMELAAAFTDEAVLLEKGRVVFQGSSMDVGDSYHSLQVQHSKSQKIETSGNLEIVNVSYSKLGKEVLQIDPGGQIELLATINATGEVKRWIMAIEIWTSSGHLIFHGSSELSGIEMPAASGIQDVLVRIGPLNLGHGSYRIALGVAEGENLPAWHGISNAASFDVASPSQRGGPMLLNLDFILKS